MLRLPAAISIVVPPTSPRKTPPSASSSPRSPLRRKPPLPSPNSASSGEQRLLGRAAAVAQRLQVDLAADPAPDRRLCQGAGEAAVADVVDGGEPVGTDGVAGDGAGSRHRGDVRLRQALVELAALLGQLRAGEVG
jgi:hypothetical protein